MRTAGVTQMGCDSTVPTEESQVSITVKQSQWTQPLIKPWFASLWGRLLVENAYKE